MTQTRRRRRKSQSFTWRWHWRSLAATVYLAICLTDFMIMPVYREFSYNKLTHHQIMVDARSMEGSTAQIETLRILREDRPWAPLTNDVFHLAFGAILGVSALPMNRRRRSEAEDEPDDILDLRKSDPEEGPKEGAE